MQTRSFAVTLAAGTAAAALAGLAACQILAGIGDFTPVPAGADTGSEDGAAEAAPTRECDLAHDHCWDFDDASSALQGGWQQDPGDMTDGSSVRLDDAFSPPSPPFAARFDTPPDDAQTLFAEMSFPVPPDKTKITVGASVRIDGDAGNADLGTSLLTVDLQHADGGGPVEIGVEIAGTAQNLFIHQPGSNPRDVRIEDLQVGVWKRIRLVITLWSGRNGAALCVSFGGTEAGSTVDAGGIVLDLGGTLYVGIDYASPPSSGWSVSYDDVTLDLQ